MSHYLPVNNLKFVNFVHNIRAQVVANHSRWGISMSEITVLDPLISAFDAATRISENPETRTSAAICKRNEARNGLEAQLRPFIQGRLMHNPFVTDDDRISMGLPVHDKILTPSADPVKAPVLEVRMLAPGVLKIIFGGAGEKRHAKPKGHIGIEFRWMLGDKDHPPVDWSELLHYEFVPRSPLKLSFEGNDRGKWIYFAARWENTRGVKGPWTEIFSAVVP
ncbi:MAG: hypothetical protein LBG28_12215 [Tannerella sp.]|jgi:hypothetical protein|nr:hypothetical protein [Tannerella sp.]